MSKHNKPIITRRQFFKYATSLAAATMGLDAEATSELAQVKEKKVKVVLVRHPNAVDTKGAVNAKVIQKMLDDAVCRLFNKKDPTEAWKLLVKPSDIVGIKSNVWRPLCTPKEVEQAIKRRLLDAGVLERNIGIDDRGVLGNPIFLNSTALINTRPIRTHNWSGVGGCLKNYIMFVENPFHYHPGVCADLAAIWKLPIVKNKTKLNILVMLTPQFETLGPHHYDPKYTWAYKGLLIGTDPVAVDAVGVEILRRKRQIYFGKDKPFKPPPRHIILADIKHNLGIADLSKIKLIKLGWLEDVLI